MPVTPHSTGIRPTAPGNSTCAKGFAECSLDSGGVDCCDESKVRVPSASAEQLSCAAAANVFAAMRLVVLHFILQLFTQQHFSRTCLSV
jgi:hypothetical protein